MRGQRTLADQLKRWQQFNGSTENSLSRYESKDDYPTVTDLAKERGLSILRLRDIAVK